LNSTIRRFPSALPKFRTRRKRRATPFVGGSRHFVEVQGVVSAGSLTRLAGRDGHSFDAPRQRGFRFCVHRAAGAAQRPISNRRRPTTTSRATTALGVRAYGRLRGRGRDRDPGQRAPVRSSAISTPERSRFARCPRNGATNISELLDALAPQIGSSQGRGGEQPVLLLMASAFPVSASCGTFRPKPSRGSNFAEEVALKYGYRADQKVVNIVFVRASARPRCRRSDRCDRRRLRRCQRRRDAADAGQQRPHEPSTFTPKQQHADGGRARHPARWFDRR